MDGVCYLIGAGERFNNIICRPDSDDYVIAVDGGYDYAMHLGITPDLIIGDFDSMDNHLTEKKLINNRSEDDKENLNSAGIPVMSFPPEKDYTDMMLAAMKAVESGFKTILIYGGTGGRPDHTYANIQLLSWIAEHGSRAYLFDENFTMTAITDSRMNLFSSYRPDKQSGFITSHGFGYISVFSLSDVSEGVTINGLKYETDNLSLNRFHALGTSNEFTDSDCSIEVKKGTLLIIAETNHCRNS